MISIHIDSKTYVDPQGAAKQVLADIRFDLGDQESIAILGASGIGKTTLLHIIAGLDSAFQGQITGATEPVGFVFQSPRLLPWRSALENLCIVAPERTEAELLDLLDTVGVADAARLYPGQLSLGMARRVGIARALAVRPSMLLLDEPFASLDTSTARRLRQVLSRVLAKTALPTVLVTHDPEEALELAGRIIVLGGNPATTLHDCSSGEVAANELRDLLANIEAR